MGINLALACLTSASQQCASPTVKFSQVIENFLILIMFVTL